MECMCGICRFINDCKNEGNYENCEENKKLLEEQEIDLCETCCTDCISAGFNEDEPVTQCGCYKVN